MPASATPPFPARAARRQGFALIITVVLVAFVVLILVGLATFTRVETSVADNAGKLGAARQNALVALNIALGKLQETAGPDERVTATADASDAGAEPGARYWTGVWDTSGSNTVPDEGWLVSGTNPSPTTAIAHIATPTPAQNAVTLVGDNTADLTDLRVTVPLTDLRVPESQIPGLGTVADPTTIGRVGWWVGDEGVKASMALPLQVDIPTYAPYDTATARRILRTQVPMGPQDFVTDAASSTDTAAGFDPLFNDAARMRAVLTREQGAFLERIPSSDPLPDQWKENFHHWTTISHGVLAKTTGGGGLKEDLSRDPSLLGDAFVAWAGSGHLRPDNDNVPNQPLSGADDARRTHRLTAETSSSSPDFRQKVAPVISDFWIQFAGFHTAAFQPRLRSTAIITLWNPYSSGMVIDTDLILEVRGLPTINYVWRTTAPAVTFAASIDLNSAYQTVSGGSNGMRLRLKLPSGNPIYLRPGMMVSWSSNANTDDNPVSSALEFSSPNTKALVNITANPAGDGFWEYSPPGAPTFANVPQVSWDQTAGANLRLVLQTDEATPRELANVPMPTFPAANRGFVTAAADRIAGYAYRIQQMTPADLTPGGWWWENADFDLRAPRSQDYIGFNGIDAIATSYGSRFNIGPTGAFLLKTNPGASNNQYRDVPLFELPRLPVLSLGQLQHLRVDGEPAFAVGNTWGQGGDAYGRLWDDYFFSGLTNQVVGSIGAQSPLPFFHLRSLASDNPALAALNANTAEDLLVAGAFNVNSTSREAWRAVLQSLRPFAGATGSPEAWRAVDNLDNGVTDDGPGVEAMVRDGTRGDRTSAAAEEETASRASGFARFPQTAQEIDEFDTAAGVTTVAPDNLFRVRYRSGIRAGDNYGNAQQPVVRNLTRDQIDEMADELTGLIETHIRANGPFQSMADFLRARGGVFNNRSPIEEAIFLAGINARVNTLDPTANPPANPPGSTWNDGFSSSWLSQADVLTALGTQMQARSDTFVIRAYGDVVNPVTDEVEGRAWCEARVQRLPDAATPGVLGREFRIVEFRWLAPSDI
jgi:hypothetical protein